MEATLQKNIANGIPRRNFPGFGSARLQCMSSTAERSQARPVVTYWDIQNRSLGIRPQELRWSGTVIWIWPSHSLKMLHFVFFFFFLFVANTQPCIFSAHIHLTVFQQKISCSLIFLCLVECLFHLSYIYAISFSGWGVVGVKGKNSSVEHVCKNNTIIWFVVYF